MENSPPPLEYLFSAIEQPSPGAWSAITGFAEAWSAAHGSKFITEGEMLIVVLREGTADPEYPLLAAELRRLEQETGLTWFLGARDTRRPDDFEKAPFVEIVGNTYPPEFVPNRKQALVAAPGCPACGRHDGKTGSIAAPLIVDESLLDRQVHPAPNYAPPGLDVVSLDGGALIISSRVAELFEGNGVAGWELIPVISLSTQKPSTRLMLLRAQKSVLLPCEEHTPITAPGGCVTCGKIRGGLLGYFSVREEWLGGDEIFSRHRALLASICVSNRVYGLMKAAKVRGLWPAFGLLRCS